jgi:site-specific DNA-methyltransferase (adenine-specific)
MDENSIDATVTDPPYGLSFMGKNWDHGIPGVPFWAEALRIAKPGCHLLAFGGTRTFHRLACAIEDAGWEIRDCLGWIYGSGFPKSHNLKGEHEGWGTALKPAWEPIIMARKPLDGTVAENVRKWGTGAINVDGGRVGVDPVADASQLRTMNRSIKSEKNGWGMNQNSGDVPQVVSSKGRWPANLIHDGSEEVLELFPRTGAAGNVNLTHPKASPLLGIGDCGPRNPKINGDNGGSAARFFYVAKASRKEREMGCEGMEERQVDMTRLDADAIGCNNPNNRGGRKARNHHPTVKPLALMRYLCRLVTPPNGLILDPFMGSGTTGMAAHLEGFRFIGIDKEPDYCAIAERRIAAA